MTFEKWLASLRVGDPDQGGQVGKPVAGGMEFLREIFDKSGPVSSGELRTAWQGRELELAERAVPLVLADIQRTTNLRPRIEVRTLDIGGSWGERGLALVTAVTFDGSYTTIPLAMRMPEIICDVADNLRDHVVDELWTVWPVCPFDGLGLDPRVVRGDAVWYCRVGDHIAGLIG